MLNSRASCRARELIGVISRMARIFIFFHVMSCTYLSEADLLGSSFVIGITEAMNHSTVPLITWSYVDVG